MVYRRAIFGVIGSVINCVVACDIDQTDACRPVPHLVGPFGVGSVSRVAREAGCELKQAAVRDGVFVVESVDVGAVDLPRQTPSAT